MDPFPTVADLPGEARGTGNLWLLEAVEGLPLRFCLQADGQLRFGDAVRPLDAAELPAPATAAVRTVRREFDRDALRAAVEDVSAVTFFGVATCQHRIDYDWDRLPAFLGVDVDGTDGLLTPDAAHNSFERLGLTPTPAVERERRADSFKPDRYGFPESAYADSPVAGVSVADKHGWRGRLDNEAIAAPAWPTFEDAEGAAERLVTDALLQRFAGGDTVDAVQVALARRHRAALEASGIDPGGQPFRSAVAAVVTRET